MQYEFLRTSLDVAPSAEGGAGHPLYTAVLLAVVEVGRAARDVAISVSGEAVAHARVTRIKRLLVGVEGQIAERGVGPSTALQDAADALWAELSSVEATLPIEIAFRHDQRDRAQRRMRLARAGLRGLVTPAAAGPSFPMGQELRDLVADAICRQMPEIVAHAQAEGRARCAGAPLPDPEFAEFHMTQPEGCAGWQAQRRLAQTGGLEGVEQIP